tara:strand:- start:139 stop:609 length:471 start_codon:yes stop_codon:yes gene_type:complete
MAFIGNLIWFIFGGWLLGTLWLIFSIIFFPLLPFLLPFVGYSYWPFGRQPVSKSAITKYKKANNMKVEDYPAVKSSLKILSNIIWLPFGLVLCIVHLIAGILNFLGCILIVTIPICLPNALGNFKMARVSFAPFGVNLVPTDLAKDILKENAKSKL